MSTDSAFHPQATAAALAKLCAEQHVEASIELVVGLSDDQRDEVIGASLEMLDALCHVVVRTCRRHASASGELLRHPANLVGLPELMCQIAGEMFDYLGPSPEESEEVWDAYEDDSYRWSLSRAAELFERNVWHQLTEHDRPSEP